MPDAFEQAKEWGRELLLRACAQDLADAHGMSLEAALEVVRKAATPPPPPTTVEEIIRANILEALTNLAVWGQHPPPPKGPELVGIGPPYASVQGPSPIASWVDEIRHVTTAADLEREIEAIRHDPLWGLERSRTGA